MRFGDYIRDRRQSLKWTQPEAAKQIGIEQSYLSKLESGKSYPSEDVFSSLMKAYKLDLDDLRDKVFSADLDRLREISEVRSLILKNERTKRKRVQNWIFASVLALTLGGGCLGTSFLAEDKTVTQFQYKSEVVGSDNPKGRIRTAEQVKKGEEKYLSLTEYKDVVFFEKVPDGTREWRFYGATETTVQSPLRWFMVPAIALIFASLGGFFASYRMS